MRCLPFLLSDKCHNYFYKKIVQKLSLELLFIKKCKEYLVSVALQKEYIRINVKIILMNDSKSKCVPLTKVVLFDD